MMKHIVTFRKFADVRRQAELDRPICRDYVLESSLDSQADLERYLPHPSHVSLIQALKTYFEWVACDYTFEHVWRYRRSVTRRKRRPHRSPATRLAIEWVLGDASTLAS